MSWLVLVNLTQARIILEEEPQLKECCHHIPCRQSVGVLLNNDWYGGAQPTRGGVTLRR